MYLGIDLGTSEVKLVLLATSGSIVAQAGVKLGISRPHPGWSEQAPADWWAATQSAVTQLRQRAPQAWSAVRAIGLSGQMHGAVLLDAIGEVLRPAILWNDVRSAQQCEGLTRALPTLPQIAGNLAMPGFTAPKLAWVREHEPAVFERVAKVLLPKDYLRFRMTGAFVSEMSDAAGTLWLDVARRAWSDELLAVTGLTRAHMPELVEGSAVSARLSPEIAGAWGLPTSVVVAGGGSDNAASAVGIGAVKPGDGFLSLGTSGVLFVVNDRFRPNPASAVHAFCHALPDRWHQMAVMLSAASCLHWVTQLVGAENEASLLTRTETLSDAERDAAPIFLPYLSGERTPHNDAKARGVFFGLNHDTDARALCHAVLEGVAFGLRDGLDALRAAGTDVNSLALVGGGARSTMWAQLHADVLGVEVHTVDGGEAGGALGAARLAWLADGGNEAEVCRPPALRQSFTPHASRTAALFARHQRFRGLYAATRDLFVG
ncbi:xylulokinase [Rhizobacter sp. J219]|uniref:xylulokinase n=1 Tax=Rhizobacter sp. J219 TaxID=2898430 RepID=UPI002150C17E|nr:xylulokinase [Rhizobacter sp. J219]MCR5881749.1 xylulokinase [Rhizobacter sp. J219]